MKHAVSYLEPVNLLNLTTKSSSFNTDKWAINNNYSISVVVNTISSTGLIADIKIQGSLDGTTWLDLKYMKTKVTGDDDVLFTLTQLDPLYFIRVSVTIFEGSSIFNIQARAV